MLSPLQLNEYTLEHVQIDVAKSQPKAEPGCDVVGQMDFEFHTEVAQHPTQKEYMVLLETDCRRKKGQKARFDRIRVVIRGFFSLPDDAPDDFVEKVVPDNCIAMLYGVTRGVVAQLTALTSPGACFLPTVNFTEALVAKPPDHPSPTTKHDRR